MINNNQASPNRSVWEQWDWIWHISAYGLLGLTIVLVFNRTSYLPSLTLFIILSVLFGVWYIPFITISTMSWWTFPQRGALYLFCGWVLMGGLILLNGQAFLLIGVFFPLYFTRFSIRWAISLAIFQISGLILLFLLTSPPQFWYIALIIAGVLAIAILIGAFISSLIRQSLARQHLLDELIATRASLLKAEREAGMLAERQRVSRDIHDTLAQHFTSIIMQLAAARFGDENARQTHVEQAEQIARDGLNESRRIIWNMRPELLENASLVESIEGLAARWSVENGIDVNVTVTGIVCVLAPNVEAALLRIIQEALHNIKKYSKAQQVNITFSYMSDLLALDIVDDGTGFDSNKKQGRGFGLKTMHERTEAIGGTLTIESDVGKGTAVSVSLPITNDVGEETAVSVSLPI